MAEPIIPVRIGIHIGDILQTNDEIIGDAVNVASRIESCAVPGSILISDKVHDQIRNHRHIKAKFLDVFELKNVDDVMPIFAISNEGLVVPKKEDIKGKFKKSNIDKNKTTSRKSIILITLAFLVVLLVVILKYQSILKKEKPKEQELSIAVITSYSIHYTKLYDNSLTT